MIRDRVRPIVAQNGVFGHYCARRYFHLALLISIGVRREELGSAW